MRVCTRPMHRVINPATCEKMLATRTPTAETIIVVEGFSNTISAK
jgi:hypothetical protein